MERLFSEISRARSEAVIVLPSPEIDEMRTEIAKLAVKRRLPSMFAFRQHAYAGGLMSYGANLLDASRRAATYVDKILKGAKPGELPIEQRSKFELIINLKTAKALGLPIPPSSLLLRADEVTR